MIIVISPDGLGLPSKEYYENTNLVDKYEDVLSQVIGALLPDHKDDNETLRATWAQHSGDPRVAARGQSGILARKVVEFEMELAAATPEAEDGNDVTVCDSLQRVGSHPFSLPY